MMASVLLPETFPAWMRDIESRLRIQERRPQFVADGYSDIDGVDTAGGGGDARGIISADVDVNGNLIITYTDGTVENVGHVVGAPGAQGPPGDPGAPGATGPTGPTGATGPGVATGGAPGQVLEKNSAADFDTKWVTPSGAGLPPGGTTGQALLKHSATDFDATWQSGLPMSLFLTQTDANLCTAPGWYLLATGATNVPVATYAYYLLTNTDPGQAAAGTPTYTQVAFRATTNITGPGIQQWQRTGYNGAWSPWIPTMIGFDNAGTKLASDLSTTYTLGWTQQTFTTAQAQAGGWPINNYCQVITIRDAAGGSACSQWCLGSVPGANGLSYFRSGNTSGWSPWCLTSEDTGWITAPLASGFTGDVKYRRVNGIVYWSGSASGTFAAGSTIVLIASGGVPAGFRGTSGYFLVTGGTNAAASTARLYLNNSNGGVSCQVSAAATQVWFSALSGYPADA